VRLLGPMLVAAMLGAACGRAGEPSSAPPGPSPEPVSLPDISSADEAVQQTIRERYGSLQDALERRAEPSALAAAYGELGKLLIAAEYYDVAETCLVEAGRLASGDMRWPYLLGHVFRYRNDPAGAASAFEQALARAPDDAPSLVWLAEMRLAQDRPQDAEAALQRALALDPSSGAALFGLGRASLARQDYRQAVDYLERALAAAPQATRIQYPLALAYRGLGDRDRAEAHLRERGEADVPMTDPLLSEVAGLLQNAAAYETRGSQALEARQWPEAIENLSKAVELVPDNAFSRVNLGMALYMHGEPDAALTQYRAAVRLSPGLARAHFGIGVLTEARGLDEEAISAFSTAVANDPDYVEARFSLANALRRTGRVQESLAHYAEVLRLNPAVSQASFGYAMGLVRLGRYREALDRLQDAMRSFPDQLGFAHAVARLLAAAPEDGVRDGARALSLVSRLLETERTLAVAETMAMALAELGRFDEAARWQRDAIESARAAGLPEVAARLEPNLTLYESGRPCRTPWPADDPVHHPRPSP